MAAEKAGGDGEAFWRFSLGFYAQPEVAPALIALQDRAGRDVNVILYALWLGVVGGRVMNAADLAAAEGAAAPLHDAVVGALRDLRRRLRPDPDPDIQAMRRRIQALEIAAERLVQYRIARSSARCGETAANRVAAAAANLARYLGEAADSAEAETIRQALARFSRRRA